MQTFCLLKRGKLCCQDGHTLFLQRTSTQEPGNLRMSLWLGWTGHLQPVCCPGKIWKKGENTDTVSSVCQHKGTRIFSNLLGISFSFITNKWNVTIPLQRSCLFMLNIYSRKMKLSLCNKKKYEGHMFVNLISSYLDNKLRGFDPLLLFFMNEIKIVSYSFSSSVIEYNSNEKLLKAWSGARFYKNQHYVLSRYEENLTQ